MRMLDASILGNQVEKKPPSRKKNGKKKRKMGKINTFGQLNIKKNLLGCFII